MEEVSVRRYSPFTSTGQTTEYKGYPREDGSSIIECTIPKMTENLHSGDSLSVRLVDSKKLSSGNTEIEIVYPDVATGLSFYTEFALTTPQTFDADKSGTIDIPLVGSAIGKCQSGLITFGKTNWPTTPVILFRQILTQYSIVWVRKPFTRKKAFYDKFRGAVQENNNHRSNAMKIMAATFNGVARLVTIIKPMPNIKKHMQIIPIY